MSQLMVDPMLSVAQLAFALLAAAVFAALYWHRRHVFREGATRGGQSFYTLADIAPAGIWRTDARGQCLYVNKAWEEMAQLTDWEGEGWANALHPDDAERMFATFMTAVAKEAKFEAEWRWQRPNGESYWVKGMGMPEYADDGSVKGYVGINIDIQQSKDLERDLVEARERAEHAAASKATFLANMSHEIRTPMNGVIGFTDLLLQSELSDEQQAQVQMIADSGRAMMQLLNDILDHSKIEAGQLAIANEPTDLRQKLGHCIKLVEPMARAKGLTLGCWVDDAVPSLVMLDRLRLRQVLLNLIGNAIKFTQVGGIDVEARVENSSEGRCLQISIMDTGIGIEANRLDAIFQPFLQEDGSTARRYGGTGLGLAISSQLVGMMGGRITVHSTPDVGTQFCVRLPLEQAEPLPVAAPTAGDQAPRGLKGVRVLIAEDHAINQQLIMAMATALGLDAELARDGEEAVMAVVAADDAGTPFAAVLMDMQMPGVDGLEATRQLRRLGFDAESLPIIALTANCYPDDVVACEQAGMQSHLGKPVTTVALARELSRWLHRRGDDADLRDTGPDGSADDHLPRTIAGLENRYRSRKSEVLAELRQSLERGSAADWTVIGDKLHKLAGVAANFGEPELGEASRRLERRIKTADTPQELIEALRREWSIFEKAA